MTTMPRYYCKEDQREIDLGEPVMWAAEQVTTKDASTGDEVVIDGAAVYFHKACWDALEGKDNYRALREGTLGEVVRGA
jgi:hypothetical protein